MLLGGARGEKRRARCPIKSETIFVRFANRTASPRETWRLGVAQNHALKPVVPCAFSFLLSFFLFIYPSFSTISLSLFFSLSLLSLISPSVFLSFLFLSFSSVTLSLLFPYFYLPFFLFLTFFYFLSFFLSFYLSFSFYPSFFTISLSQYV